MAGGGADSESGGSGGNYSVKSFATSTPVKGTATLSPSLSQAIKQALYLLRSPVIKFR